jgi:hypothetical protein
MQESARGLRDLLFFTHALQKTDASLPQRREFFIAKPIPHSTTPGNS